VFFNSVDFAVFLPLVFLIYWFIAGGNIRFQNIFISAASYFFYGCWDWRFLFLIFFSTLVDYTVGLSLSVRKDKNARKFLLFISVFVNLLFLGFFKYCNFFVDNFIRAFSLFGMKLTARHLNIILPVGISFYTFQTMSYSIDVYKKRLEPVKDFFAFAAFVSFFPQLVAGPIERASNLLPQFGKRRVFNFDEAAEGCKQMLWGFFKKLVIADNCAIFANMIFNNSDDYSGSVLVLGALFFAFQIYGDFSGYSDIATGTARLFGISLMKNFDYPYFSRDIAEFWRRWHISLTTWFRDYVYIPLGGSRGGSRITIRNTLLIFILSGLWHGADWSFIIWGLLNAAYFLPLLPRKKNRAHLAVAAKGRLLPDLKDLASMIATFGLTVFAWIFFRAENTGHALRYISGIFSASLFTIPVFPRSRRALLTLALTAGFMLVEWLGRESPCAVAQLPRKISQPLRLLFYFLVFLSIWFTANSSETVEFIYFQF
jgi:D-alanyl-lipoteichoic acid acyltransferase DltB (MBOAT superfamily)